MKGPNSNKLMSGQKTTTELNQNIYSLTYRVIEKDVRDFEVK